MTRWLFIEIETVQSNTKSLIIRDTQIKTVLKCHLTTPVSIKNYKVGYQYNWVEQVILNLCAIGWNEYS